MRIFVSKIIKRFSFDKVHRATSYLYEQILFHLTFLSNGARVTREHIDQGVYKVLKVP